MTYRSQSKDSSLTHTQESIVFALNVLVSDRFEPNGEGGFIYVEGVTGQAIARYIGGQWSHYRKQLASDLIAKDWLEGKVLFGRKYYRLSSTAKTWVDSLISDAKKGRSTWLYVKGSNNG